MKALGKLLAPRDVKSRRFWALICLALLLTLQLFVCAPALHRMIHPNAASPNHHCVITLLARGQVSAADTSPILAMFVALLVFWVAPISASWVSSFDFRLSPSRAPPQASPLF